MKTKSLAFTLLGIFIGYFGLTWFLISSITAVIVIILLDLLGFLK